MHQMDCTCIKMQPLAGACPPAQDPPFGFRHVEKMDDVCTPLQFLDQSELNMLLAMEQVRVPSTFQGFHMAVLSV